MWITHTVKRAVNIMVLYWPKAEELKNAAHTL